MFCNLTGLKPTYGVCSRYGIIAFASGSSQAGPFAQTVEDCALLLIKRWPALTRTTPPRWIDRRGTTRDLNNPLAGLRIGRRKEFFGDGVVPDIARAPWMPPDVTTQTGRHDGRNPRCQRHISGPGVLRRRTG